MRFLAIILLSLFVSACMPELTKYGEAEYMCTLDEFTYACSLHDDDLSCSFDIIGFDCEVD